MDLIIAKTDTVYLCVCTEGWFIGFRVGTEDDEDKFAAGSDASENDGIVGIVLVVSNVWNGLQ